MYSVYIINNELFISKTEFNILINLVSLEKQMRIKKFLYLKDAQNCLFTDIIIRMIICNVTGMKNKPLMFSENKYGKPFLINNTNIHFNGSHAEDYIVCAFDSQPIGIDVEIMKPTNLRIAERYFKSDELAYIKVDNKDTSIQRFYEIWTKKESRMKWEGMGLAKPLSAFSVFDTMELEHISYHKILQNDEAICHVCSVNRHAPPIRMVEITDLLKFASAEERTLSS